MANAKSKTGFSHMKRVKSNYRSKFGKEPRYTVEAFRGVLRKRCFEITQQIYRISPMPKCDLLHFSMGVLLKICCIFSELLFLLEPLLSLIRMVMAGKLCAEHNSTNVAEVFIQYTTKKLEENVR